MSCTLFCSRLLRWAAALSSACTSAGGGELCHTMTRHGKPTGPPNTTCSAGTRCCWVTTCLQRSRQSESLAEHPPLLSCAAGQPLRALPWGQQPTRDLGLMQRQGRRCRRTRSPLM